MNQFLYALYPDPDSAQRAVNALRDAATELGVGAREIVVLSSEPFDGYEFFEQDHKSIVPWIAALGGLAGGVTGFWFAAFTQNAYPLNTGGMAIVPFAPNGVITYEMTMLGAILATLFSFLISARLPNWKRQVYDAEISDGKILVGVMDAPENARAAVEKKFLDAGAERVKELSI
jgi:hypothetical protein